jgi:hypothetical protein
MSYATTDDVLARAGRVQGVFTVAGKRPNLADLEKFLDDTASDINAAVLARGFDPALFDESTSEAFRDLNAYGALARGLAAIQNPPRDLLAEARSVWEAAMGTATDPGGTIAAGTFPAIAMLEAGAGGGGTGPSAGALWTDEETYGSVSSVISEANQLRDTNLAPEFSREMKL